MGYISFELNYGFQPKVSSKEDENLHSKSKFADARAITLHKLTSAYKKISNIHKSSKNDFLTNTPNLGAMPPDRRDNLISNISNSNKTTT